MTKSIRPPGPPESDEDVVSGDVPAPASSSGAVEAVASVAPPRAREDRGRIIVALQRFMASKQGDEGRAFVRAVIVVRMGADIEPALLDELIHLAVKRCLEAKSPPWFESTIRSWVARCTRRAIAEYFRSRESDEKNLEPGADPAATFDRHLPGTDWGARGHLIAKWLEKQLGDDPFRRETFRLMVAYEVDGWTLAELAEKHRTTPSALSNRFFKLRQELIPRVRTMDDEKKRMMVLFFLGFGGLAAAVAIAVVVMGILYPSRPPYVPPHPQRTYVEPTFDQAEPPDREEPPTKR